MCFYKREYTCTPTRLCVLDVNQDDTQARERADREAVVCSLAQLYVHIVCEQLFVKSFATSHSTIRVQRLFVQQQDGDDAQVGEDAAEDEHRPANEQDTPQETIVRLVILY